MGARCDFGGESFGNIDLVTAHRELGEHRSSMDHTMVGPEKVVQSATIPRRGPGVRDRRTWWPQPSGRAGRRERAPGGPGERLLDLRRGRPAHAVACDRRGGRAGRRGLHRRGQPEQVIAPDVAADVSYALQAVVEDGSGFAAQASRPAGRGQDRDDERQQVVLWFAGYVPQLSGAVAVGGGVGADPPDGWPQSVTGGRFPASVWTAFMQGALEGTEVADSLSPRT